MGKLVEPQVFLVGYTTIDRNGLDAYLQASGNEDFLQSLTAARVSGLSDAECLISMMAKLCYASLTLGKNNNITRVRDISGNLQATWDQGHSSVWEHCVLNFVVHNCSRVFCYEAGTEVFTLEGWRPIELLVAGDTILALDTSLGQARWTQVESVHEFPYEGEMLGWSNSQMLSPLMTPDHILWLAWHDLRCARGISSEENINSNGRKVPFSEAFGKRFVIRKDIPWHKNALGEMFQIGSRSYDVVSLFSWLGWMATDGGFNKDRPSRCTITQVKPGNIASLRALMDELFPGRWKMHGPYGESRSVQFSVFDRDLADFARSHIGPSKEKRRFSRWLFDAGTVPLRAFLEAAIDGDGHRHPKSGHVCLYVGTAIAAGQYQAIAAMLGMPANVRMDDRVGQSHDVAGVPVAQTKPSFVVDFSRRGGATLVKPEYQFRHSYSGKVYCPKTVEGVIYVRKTGHAFWCGNTHELIRHRAGTAFSQTSGRYVRSDSVDIVFDPILNPVWEDVRILQSLIEERYRAMVDKMQLDTMTDFSLKKKITSALRRLLPNGQANEIGFSVNLRSLRHIIQMRTSRHAEWEIRLVFQQVYQLVKSRFPLLFYGAKEEVVDGIVEVSGMKMQPYERSV